MEFAVRVALTLLLIGFACTRLRADTVLFDDRIDSQQKTEIRYDVPDGCVITGLGFRANYDNITTMYVRHHRLSAEGRLTDADEVLLGSEPNHACEARVDLPDGWVAVGYGAAGEPEWDVTLLRIWARQLQPDGALGEIKTFSNGFKPERDPERQTVLGEADRVLTGAGLRFASNDIGGIYARSKRILNLTSEAQQRIRAFKTRAWLASGVLYSRLADLEGDLQAHKVTRLDITIPRELSKFPVSGSRESYIWVRTTDFEKIKHTLRDAPRFTGIVVNLAATPLPQRSSGALRKLYEACEADKLKMALRLDHRANPLSEENIRLVHTMPRSVNLIIPLFDRKVFKHSLEPLDFAPFGDRDIIVEFDLIRQSMGASRIPDVRVDELPGLITEAALAGAEGFIVQVGLVSRELLDGINSPSLLALHRLAADPFQPTEPLWDGLCTAKYGRAAKHAAASLRRTAAINDLIFRTYDYPIIWYNGMIHPVSEIDRRIEKFAEATSSPEAKATLQELLEPTDSTIDHASYEKETALWLLAQSISDANQAQQANPTPQTRRLYASMQALRSAAIYWHNATQAYLLTKMYTFDGAPATRQSVRNSLDALTLTGSQSGDYPALLGAGRSAFARTIEGSLEYYEERAALPSALGRVRTVSQEGKANEAAAELGRIMHSPDFAAHLDKQREMIGRIASSLNAFGDLTSNIAVMRHGDGSWGIEKVAGRWSWAIGPGRPCLYLDFPAGPLEKPADYILSFEYFDRGDWTLTFHYDSAYPPDQKSDYHPAEPLQLTNTETWKKGAFVLTDCLFASRQNDRADMRFVTGLGANIRNIRLAPAPTGSIDKEKGKRLFYRILGSQSNGPYIRKTRTVAAPDYFPRTATTGMANSGFTEYPFCYGNWSLTFRECEGLFPRFIMSLPMDPTRVNTCDILTDWVYEPDGCVWGPACHEFGQTFVAKHRELVAITLLVASPKATFDLSVYETGPDGLQIAKTKSFTSGHSMEWATVHYAPGEAQLQPGKTYYVKIVGQDGKAWNPYLHSTGNAYDKGCAYFEGVMRPESDLALWITTEPPDVTRAVVLNTDEEGWTRPASGFEFVPRTDNVRMITVQLRPVREFCVWPVAYIYQTEPERRLICGPKYSHSCARVNTTYEVSFLYAPGELPCAAGRKYYAEIFTVPFEEGKDPVIPDDYSSLTKYEILPSVYGETLSEPTPVIYNLTADPSANSTLRLTWQLSKPGRVRIQILAPESIAKTVNVAAGTNEYRIVGLGPGEDCDFRLTASFPDGPAAPLYARPTPVYRVRIPGGEPAEPLWPETPEFFVPLAPRPTAKGLPDEFPAHGEEISMPDGDFESGVGKWSEDRTGIGGLSGGDEQIKPASGSQMYGWTHKAGKERKDVFQENVIHQGVPTRPGHKYVLAADAITAVTNGTRGDTRIRLAVDPAGGTELKGKNSSQWFWTDAKWMTFSHEFTAESEKATIAVGFFRWRDLDRADAYIDNIRLYDLGSKP